MPDQRRGLDAFVFYRDSAERRAALQGPRHAPGRYVLFGLDELRESGVRVRHNLEQEGPPPFWARLAGRMIAWLVRVLGGYGGDFAGVITALRRASRSDVILSTVDTVGIPLLFLLRLGVVRRPLVYVSIGLPERLARLRWPRLRGVYAAGLRRCARVVSYSQAEARILGDLVAPASTVVFVPFGVDTDVFAPSSSAENGEVLAVGRDPYRDFALLRDVAVRRPELNVRIVCSGAQARDLALAPSPPNVTVETDLPLEAVRDRVGQASVIALPVRENSYSGATTTLLQAMAMGKACVVSLTEALAEGYGLVDGENCRLVPPGDAFALEQAVTALISDKPARAALGRKARETAVEHLGWTAYAERIRELLADAVSRG
jgi:glycosyltransferase involved in cell wall biosynthesis